VSSLAPETDRDGFYAAGFWGPRGEDLETAARRLKRFLVQLKTIHPLLAEWYFGTEREGAPQVVIPSSEAGLREWISERARQMREGVSSNIAHSLGAMVGAWAGDYTVSAGLSARFGFTSERIGNAVVLTLPGVLDPLFADLTTSQSLIDAIVSSWDPDRAVLRPRDVLRDDAPRVKPGEIVQTETFWKRFPDWIVYKRGEPLELGGPFRGKAP
jgi:hypothetical protein